MKEIENVQENLKSLPKHTLNEGQKENIIRALRKKTTSNKRVQFTKPLMAFALLCATVFVLVLSSDNGLRHLFQLQVSLTV
ncbi:hypothetical protein MKY34_07180 [Sporosarcina sp. FSL K6-1522]|uniref:hypothetical protein n=1 Tax=Sporosarcina sp. FSL K6-1522 TaxID=2921554 RepID=UPI00315A7BEE